MTSARRVLLALFTLSFAVLTHAQFKIASSPTSMSFSATVGSAAVKQTLLLDAGGGNSFQIAASTSSGGNWLSVTPSSGTSGGSLTVTATPGTLGANGYHGTLTVTASGTSNSPYTVPVTLVVRLPTMVTLLFAPMVVEVTLPLLMK